jgi:putative spermidine/putrescine transport system substrate-binding protein
MLRHKSSWFYLVAAVLILSFAVQCAPAPEPEVIVETVVVEKEVVVTQEVEVEKEVIVTQEVEKEVVVVATPEPGIEMPDEIVFMDDQSGANFQLWFQTYALPSAEEALGFKINYVVGSDAETYERMKAWKEGEGDFAVLFPKSTGALLSEDIPLETLTPEKIPNMVKIDPVLQVASGGVPINDKAVAYWYSTYALIYNSEYIPDPPKSWAEFYDRREEWKGHIGIVRPDAKSSSSWRQPYVFLNAFYDFSGEFDPEDPTFQEAWEKARDFYTYATLPLAAEPTNMFENFNAGDSWISLYALDYALWSAREGTMPPTTKAAFLEEGVDTGGQEYFVVPANISEGQKAAGYKLINYLLSDDQQIRLVSTMWQYNSTMINDMVPPIVWEQIPTPQEARAAQIPPEKVNSVAIEWVKEHGLELVP